MFTGRVAIVLHCSEYIDYISPLYIVWKDVSKYCLHHAVGIIFNTYSQLNYS
jgi:hypothetical protein